MKNGIIQDGKTKKWLIDTSFSINGKRHHCCIRGYDTRKEAELDYERAVNEWKSKKGLQTDSVILFKDFELMYRDYRSIKMTRGTLLKDQSLFNKHLIPRFGNYPVSLVFEKRPVIYFYNSLNVSNNTKFRIITLMRDLCLFAFQHHLITDKDYQDCLLILVQPRLNKSNKENKRVASKSEKQAFLDTFDRKGWYFPMFSLFFVLGARISEFLGICKDCVDLDNSKITIKKQLLTNGQLSDILKTSASYRVIPIPRDICNLLTPLMQKNYTRLFNISHTHFKRLLHEHEKMAGIPNYSSHEIGRHTRASELGSVCKTMSEVVTCARIMGHSSSMFLDTYCHSLKENEELEIISRI